MNSSSSIQAVVPALNCASTISRVVSGVKDQGIEVLVVDDGSRDDTAARARDAGAEVIRHPANRGKGAALISGFRWCLERGKRHIATLDADGQHAPADLPRLLAIREQAPLVIGRRQIRVDPMPTSSFIGNCVSSFFISLFCGTFFPDTQCGFRIYSEELLRQVPLRGGGFETETELLMRAARLGLEIRWVPIQTIYTTGRETRRTNFRTARDSLRVIRTVLRSPLYPRSVR